MLPFLSWTTFKILVSLSVISCLTLSLSPNKIQIYGDQACHQPFITVSFSSISSNSVWGIEKMFYHTR
jgi:hypothetical protein